MSAAANRMAATVDRLQGHVDDASTAGAEAGGALRAVADALGGLHDQLVACGEPLHRIGGSVDSLADMLRALEKLAARAELLAVNAAIEAAHIDGQNGGSRFAIVASEVRTLSLSTYDAAADVKRIAVDLHNAAERVTRATATSTTAAAQTVAGVRQSESTFTAAHAAIADLEESVNAIASASGEQSAALQTVLGSVEDIAQHASAARRATADAGDVALEQRVRTAESRVKAWTDGASSGDALARIDEDQRAILGDLIAVAVSAANNAVAWRAIDGSLTALRGEIENVRRTVGESTAAARSASGASQAMRDVVTSMKRRYDEAMDALDRGLLAIADVENAVVDADRRVEAMTAAVARTNEIVRLINSVSADTSMLSLNAAIESSRAGKSGRGFGVIADEIRRLAGATQEVTSSVSAVVARVGSESEHVRTAIAGVGDSAAAVTEGAGSVRIAVESLRAALESTLECALEVSTAATGQVRGLERVLDNTSRSASALDAASNGTDDGRLDLYALGDRAHHVAARRGIATDTVRVRAFIDALASRIEAEIERQVASGRVSLATLFDFRYEEITGDGIARLAPLFDIGRVPARGFAPPKFATPWDRAIDETIIPLLDDAMKDGAFARPIVVATTDLNGFAYAYPRAFIAPWTGDDARDRAGNRVKRILEEPHALHLTRSGLGSGAKRIGVRAPYAAFEAAGCALTRPDGERPWTISVFARDLNDVLNDLIVPLYVHGRRHGSLRFGYAVDIL